MCTQTTGNMLCSYSQNPPTSPVEKANGLYAGFVVRAAWHGGLRCWVLRTWCNKNNWEVWDWTVAIGRRCRCRKLSKKVTANIREHSGIHEKDWTICYCIISFLWLLLWWLSELSEPTCVRQHVWDTYVVFLDAANVSLFSQWNDIILSRRLEGALENLEMYFSPSGRQHSIDNYTNEFANILCKIFFSNRQLKLTKYWCGVFPKLWS